jgi:diguanylate cyclase (GGDEF)-like protein
MSERDESHELVGRLTKRLERERRARLQAEAIAEQGLRELFDRQQELLLLEAIAESANTASSVDAAMTDALRIICGYTGWRAGHAWLSVGDIKTGTCELVSTNVWRIEGPHDLGALREAAHSIRLAADPFLQQIVLTGTPAWVLDVVTEPAYSRAPHVVAGGLRSVFAFPILIGTEVVAVLEFFASHTVAPTRRLVEIMTHVGTQLGRVIERKRAHDHLIDAFHDPLTQLPNRALFLRQLQAALGRVRRNPNQLFAVLFLDVDGFKMVNDSRGHLAGDQLIVQIGRRLMSCVRREDTVARAAERTEFPGTVARLGGDEFTILLEDVRHISDGVRVAERILHAVQPPFLLDGIEVFTTLSIGIATSASRHVAPEDILRDADMAMYRAKLQGKGRCELFDPAMHAAAVTRLQFETDLRHALERDELTLVYQPIVSLGTGRIAGVEALLRWRHADRGVVTPADFISVAEESGAILQIGEWVLRRACEQLTEWQPLMSDQAFFVAVNVSAKQFASSGFGQQLADVLIRTGVTPASVMLELTESAAMGNAERSRELLFDIKALGVRVTIDDFGTAYSSLSYLTRFPVDALKVDRSFVSRMEEHDHSREVVKTIVTLGHNLGLDVTAEGTETKGQVEKVRLLGCQYAQGYFFGPPTGPSELRHWLTDREVRVSP